MSFLSAFASLAKLSANYASASRIPFLRIRAASLYFSQDMCPCFHCLRVSFLHFSLNRRPSLSHAGLLASLPDFLYLASESSCALRKMSLKSSRLFSAPLSQSAASQGIPSAASLDNRKFALPKIQHPDSALLLARIPQDCKLYQAMTAAACRDP